MKTMILGSGVSAALAANVLGRETRVKLVCARDVKYSPIPELVPRKMFFDALGVTKKEEENAVAVVAPRKMDIVWNTESGRRTRQLNSTDNYLVFDKGRMAEWLRVRAGTLDVEVHMSEKFGNLEDYQDYERLIDCRGYNAENKNIEYEFHQEAQARTSCTYAIAYRPETVSANEMTFWTESHDGYAIKTYFSIPISEELFSVGCSFRPENHVNTRELLTTMHEFGIPLSENEIRFSGQVTPYVVTTRSRAPRLIPIGEASRRSCPLTEYGVMAALSQVLHLAGKPRLSEDALVRPVHCEIDPHIPLELF